MILQNREKTMRIFPAIDLRDGQVVRLTEGDYDRMEVYSSNPAETARRFREKNADCLHIVDLDGARDGELSNYAVIREIVEAGGLFVQVGGGIRDEERVRRYLALGVGRVILGTAALEDFGFLERMVERYGGRIAVSVDAREGRVAVRGWREVTGTDSLAFCKRLEQAGVRTLVYTDIARDGKLSGANLAVYRELSGLVSCDIIASGGVSSAEDILSLRDMGLCGAIVGKALYTGALELGEVLRLCS